jgi:hypothetical protein
VSVTQLLGLLGCATLLAAYAGLQLLGLRRERVLFNAANIVGSLLLLWVALVDVRWGFIILESVWTLVSIPPLVRGLRAR